MIPSNRQTARLAGFLYFIIAITGGFGHFSLLGGIMVPGNATETVEHIRASGMLFRLGFLSNLLCQLCFIVLPLVLYKLLSPINKRQTVLMPAIVLVALSLAFIAMLTQFGLFHLFMRSSNHDLFQSLYSSTIRS